jgi:GNAT superfamily N-acetyltransferase
MTSRSQLVPGRPPPASLEMVQIAPEAAELLRSTYVRIWTALASGGRLGWTETQWREDVSKPGVSVWVARVDGRVVGLLELDAESNGDVGIVVFGLVPELIGRGFGAAFLTRATEMAWDIAWRGNATRRVSVQTSSDDHPNSLPNYERRGFKRFRSERHHSETQSEPTQLTPANSADTSASDGSSSLDA